MTTLETIFMVFALIEGVILLCVILNQISFAESLRKVVKLQIAQGEVIKDFVERDIPFLKALGANCNHNTSDLFSKVQTHSERIFFLELANKKKKPDARPRKKR